MGISEKPTIEKLSLPISKGANSFLWYFNIVGRI